MQHRIRQLDLLHRASFNVRGTHKIKRLHEAGIDPYSEQGKKTAVLGALSLYLDFINLFLFLLRIFGRR